MFHNDVELTDTKHGNAIRQVQWHHYRFACLAKSLELAPKRLNTKGRSSICNAYDNVAVWAMQRCPYQQGKK